VNIAQPAGTVALPGNFLQFSLHHVDHDNSAKLHTVYLLFFSFFPLVPVLGQDFATCVCNRRTTLTAMRHAPPALQVMDFLGLPLIQLCRSVRQTVKIERLCGSAMFAQYRRSDDGPLSAAHVVRRGQRS